MAKRRRKKSIGHIVTLVSFVIMLNSIGVGYAYWTGNLNIAASLSTGNMDLQFIDLKKETMIDTHQGIEDLQVNYDDDFRIMRINGKVNADYKGVLHFGVINNGSIPVKYDQRGDGPEMKEGLELQVNQQSKPLGPGETLYHERNNPNGNEEPKQVGNPKVHIKVDERFAKQENSSNGEDGGSGSAEDGSGEETFDFRIVLPYKQWNR